MIALDSSAVIEITRGTKKGELICKKIGEEEVALTSFVVHELILGALPKDQALIDDFIKDSVVLAFDGAATYKSAEIEKSLLRKGVVIGRSDIFTAALCMLYDISLITLDKDFQRIQGLKTILIEDAPEKTAARKA